MEYRRWRMRQVSRHMSGVTTGARNTPFALLHVCTGAYSIHIMARAMSLRGSGKLHATYCIHRRWGNCPLRIRMPTHMYLPRPWKPNRPTPLQTAPDAQPPAESPPLTRVMGIYLHNC